MNLCAARVAPEKAVFRPALPMHFQPEFTGEHMAKMSFAEQIKHPKWQERRLQIMSAASFCCQKCGTNEVTLNVHHKRYVKGRMYWEYEDGELECLCEDCHKQEHTNRELLERILLQAGEQVPAVEIAIGLLGGYFAASVCIDPELEESAIDVDGESHDLGILAGIAAGRSWPLLVAAVDALLPKSLSPAEDAAYTRWKGEGQK